MREKKCGVPYSSVFIRKIVKQHVSNHTLRIRICQCFHEGRKDGYWEDMKAYWNDVYVDASEISISPFDLGMLRGFAIFDVMVVEHGKAFLWERHYDRLAASARSIGLAVPLDKAAYGKVLAQLIEASPTPELVLRTVLSGGPSENGFAHEQVS